jgi:dGTPase
MAEQEREFTRFMYARLYHHPLQLAVAEKAHQVIAGLAAAYRAEPALLPESWSIRLPEAEPARGRHIADFIAGMTDRYALARYREIIGPIDLGDCV